MAQARIADQELVRKVNKSILLNTLRLHAPISRAELAARTGLNPSTISNIIAVLMEEGLVQETHLQDTKVGRPGISLTLNPQGGAVIGVEIGVDFVSIILTDFVATVLWSQRMAIEPDQPQIQVLTLVEGMIDEALIRADHYGLRPLGIGLGLPGLVDDRNGELFFAPNLGWKNVPFRLMWSSRFHLPLYTENEANLAALGEYYFGVARGVENVIYLSSGIGLGAGVIISGKLFRGAAGFSSEVGHMKMALGGEKCGCGRNGCWETQVGPRAVLRRVKQAIQPYTDSLIHQLTCDDLNKITFQMVVDAALAGDKVCTDALEQVGIQLGLGIANLVNIFNPELVVIGGALSLGKEILSDPITQTVMVEALAPSARDLQIVFSSHGADACVYGAVAIVLDDILREMAVI